MTAVGLIASLSEPFLNMVYDLTRRLEARGISTEVITVESFCVGPKPTLSAAFVMSNDDESWETAAILSSLGVRLLNGETRSCSFDRRRWKADLTVVGANTPTWVTSPHAGPLMNAWDATAFPAYVKRAGPGRAWPKLLHNQGQLAEFFQERGQEGPWLLERALPPGQPAAKCYVAGPASQAFALVEGEVVEVSTEVANLAALVHAASGLDFFSVDYLRDAAGQASVIDVNRFPVYENRPVCWERVADRIAQVVE